MTRPGAGAETATTAPSRSTAAFSLPDATSLDVGDTFTIEAWVKRRQRSRPHRQKGIRAPTTLLLHQANNTLNIGSPTRRTRHVHGPRCRRRSGTTSSGRRRARRDAVRRRRRRHGPVTNSTIVEHARLPSKSDGVGRSSECGTARSTRSRSTRRRYRPPRWPRTTRPRTQRPAAPTDPVTLDGAVLRLDPATGAAMSGNPNLASPDANARRIVAHGFRNPFRFTFRPTTSELWVGDVGWNAWEEIDLVASPTGGRREPRLAVLRGQRPPSSYDNLNLGICEGLYAAGTAAPRRTSATATPRRSRARRARPRTARRSPAWRSTRATSYPASYNGGLFFADYTRDCIWFMPAGANGRPGRTGEVAGSSRVPSTR